MSGAEGSDLRDALAPPDHLGAIRTGQVTDIAADGSVTVDLGNGPIPGTLVLAGYTPSSGDVVQVQKRDATSWLCLGATRTSNATTQAFLRSWGVPWNVYPAPAGGGSSGTLAVAATATGSWRSGDGWSQTAPYQGAYSTSLGLWRGCYFYGGTNFATLLGRTCTSLTIRLHRSHGSGAGGVGSGGAVPQWIALHGNPSQPGGPPTFIASALNVGSLTAPDDLQVGTFALPTSWGQALIDGRAFGLAHLSGSAADYERCRTLAEDSLSGQLQIGWAT